MAVIDLGPPSQMGVVGVPAFPGGAFGIVPSDVNTYAQPVAVYVGGAGDVAVTPANGGTEVVFYNVPAGAMVPVSVKAVRLTDTTATNLIGVY